MNLPDPSQPVPASTRPVRRVFRPAWWAAALTLVVVAVTIRLGNWQGERAAWRQQQQQLQTDANQRAPLDGAGLARIANVDDGNRYQRVKLTVSFEPAALVFLDNRIVDGKAGYGVLQLATAADPLEPPRTYLIDRGWVAAPLTRDLLPDVQTPATPVTIEARLNLPPSRNPGTAANDRERRVNYVSIEELATRWKTPLAPFVLEQTGGPGFTGVDRPPAGTNYEKNLIYQMQWYSFAALAVVLFIVLSYRKQAAP